MIRKWYEVVFDEKVLAILALFGIALAVVFGGPISPTAQTIVVGIVSGVSGLAVGKALAQK